MDAVSKSRKTVIDAVLAGPNADGSTPYELKNIRNADKFALVYAAPPSRSLHAHGEACSGGKVSKARLTGMVVVNATGTDKIKPIVIGTAARPQVRNPTTRVCCCVCCCVV